MHDIPLESLSSMDFSKCALKQWIFPGASPGDTGPVISDYLSIK